MDLERWQKITALFHAAREREPGKRAAFLEDACRNDATLRQEVEALLAEHDKADHFLSVPAFDAVSEVFESDDAGHELTRGQQIGQYVVERVLGEGGMGVVYLAEDPRLRRKVAIKALPARFALDSNRRERLRHEARAAAALSHTGIATVYALEEIGDDLYVVFEYVRGNTLRAELGQGPLPFDATLDTSLQIGRALAAAHAEGIVHRDLKPENVIRCPDGSTKILDFGLARFQPDVPGGVATTRLTGEGTILGTPAYMSPEQLHGRDADHRTDIFALGVLTYELRTGIHPFQAATPTSMAARIVDTEPTPLSRMVPTDPIELDRIVRTCLKKRPEDRYQSTNHLVNDLEALRKGAAPPVSAPARGSVSVPVPPTPVLGEHWWRIHQVAIMAVYAFMALMVWLLRRDMSPRVAFAAFVVLVASAAVNGTLRAHLLFTHQFNRRALIAEMKNTARWRLWSDWIVAAALLGAAAATTGAHLALAALLAAAAVGGIVAFVIIEPATTRAAFPKRSSGVKSRPART